MRKRIRELRRAWRHFLWMVVQHKPAETLSRRTHLKIASHMALCGLLTGGEHSWGPLVRQRPTDRWRRRKCRWCGTTELPASEMEDNPLTPAEQTRARAMVGKPTDEDVAAALKHAEAAGFYKPGKGFVWDTPASNREQRPE